MRVSLTRVACNLNIMGAIPNGSSAAETACQRAWNRSASWLRAGGRARIFYAQQRYEEAARYSLQAIDRKPDCEGAYNVLGRAYFASGRFKEAADLIERAIEANGDDYNVYIPYTNCSGPARQK